jgi:hypothetical protein
MSITSHLVYDPATGHLVYSPDNHLVYANISVLNTASGWNKYGYSHSYYGGTFASCVAAMQAAAWGSADADAWEHTSDSGGGYKEWWTTAACRIWSSGDLSGNVCRKITGNVASYIMGPITYPMAPWKVGFQTNNNTTPTDDWTWVTGATSVTGTTVSDFTITVNATLGSYVWLILTLNPYTEPALDAIDGATLGTTVRLSMEP